MIENIHSPRVIFKYEDNLIKAMGRYDNDYIGFIKEIPVDNEIKIEFDIIDKYKNKGYQTEILREYLRYKFLWEKKYDVIRCYPESKETINVLLKRKFIKNNEYYYITKDIYMQSVEKLTLFDEDLNRLPYPNNRGEEIKAHTYAGIVDVVIRNKRNNKYLTTKRDINKVTSPGLWEITGGGIDYQEDIEKAVVREAKEETGLDVIEYKYLDTNKMEELVFFTYLGIVDCNEDDVKLQENETIDYKWRTKEELIELYNTDLVPKKQKIRILKNIDKI